MSTSTEVRAAIYKLLHEIAPNKAPLDNTANDDTPTDEFLDSFDTFSLIQDLEAKFEIEVADDDFSSDNLGSITRIVQFVQNKQASR